MKKIIIKDNPIFTYNDFENWLEDLGLTNKFKESDIIHIKPNLCAGDHCTYESGVVSNKVILENLVNIITEHFNKQVVICESDSIGGSRAYKKYEFQNYSFLSTDLVNFLDLTRSEMKDVDLINAKYFKEGCLISKSLHESKFFIDISKLKSHNVTKISGCVKNLFGCLPTQNKKIYHPYLELVLFDLVNLIKPDLCILDLSPAMEGDGPVRGEPVFIDKIILSNDVVEIDRFAARVMGLNPLKVKHLRIFNSSNSVIIEGQLFSKHFESISFGQKSFIWLGLHIQKTADRLHNIGHAIHGIRSFSSLILRIVRKINKILFRRSNI